MLAEIDVEDLERVRAHGPDEAQDGRARVHALHERVEGSRRVDGEDNRRVVGAFHHEREAEVPYGHRLADLDADPAGLAAVCVRRRDGLGVERVFPRRDILQNEEQMKVVCGSIGDSLEEYFKQIQSN